jgi:hypothetical protein
MGGIVGRSAQKFDNLMFFHRCGCIFFAPNVEDT